MPRRKLRTAPTAKSAGMSSSGSGVRRHRRNGMSSRQADRRSLELDGWRTTLDYRENHRRGRDGRLLAVSALWCAEAERVPAPLRARDGTARGGIDVIWATADTADGAWAQLRLEAELADVRFAGDRADDWVGGVP